MYQGCCVLWVLDVVYGLATERELVLAPTIASFAADCLFSLTGKCCGIYSNEQDLDVLGQHE